MKLSFITILNSKPDAAKENCYYFPHPDTNERISEHMLKEVWLPRERKCICICCHNSEKLNVQMIVCNDMLPCMMEEALALMWPALCKCKPKTTVQPNQIRETWSWRVHLVEFHVCLNCFRVDLSEGRFPVMIIVLYCVETLAVTILPAFLLKAHKLLPGW